jgi:hypothetical protein
VLAGPIWPASSDFRGIQGSRGVWRAPARPAALAWCGLGIGTSRDRSGHDHPNSAAPPFFFSFSSSSLKVRRMARHLPRRSHGHPPRMPIRAECDEVVIARHTDTNVIEIADCAATSARGLLIRRMNEASAHRLITFLVLSIRVEAANCRSFSSQSKKGRAIVETRGSFFHLVWGFLMARSVTRGGR